MVNSRVWIQAIGVVGVVSAALGVRLAAGNDDAAAANPPTESVAAWPAGYEVDQTLALTQLHDHYEQKSGRQLPYLVNIRTDDAVRLGSLLPPPTLTLQDREGCITVQANGSAAATDAKTADKSAALYLPEVGAAFAHRDGILALAPQLAPGQAPVFRGNVLKFGEVALHGSVLTRADLNQVTQVVIPKHCQHYENYFVDWRGTAKNALTKWRNYAADHQQSTG